MTERDRVLAYMRENMDDHIDNLTGELNVTTLAEDAIIGIGVRDVGDEAEWVYDLAYDVAWDVGRLVERAV